MPANKRQHYVPQNYLREFSPDKINIGVFHIESGKWYENAPINGQAQHSFFYGVDNNLEKELSELEGLLADNRKSIINRESNKLSQYQRDVLYQDMMLQLSRTKQMADLYEQSATSKARRIWKHSSDELVRKNADHFGIKFSIPALGPMMALLTNLEICLDLELKLLVNMTEVPFITSDAPVCKYNKLFEAYRNPYCGLSHSGLILFYPLSPKYAALYYDHNVYKVKFRKRVYLEMDDVSDIYNLNGLTCSWADRCVFYNPLIVSGEYIRWTFDHISEARRPLMVETEIKKSENSSIIVAQYPFPFLFMDLSFMKFQDKVKPRK